jgi:hypothetical protein
MRCADRPLSPIASRGYACSAIADPSQRRRCRARWHRASPALARWSAGQLRLRIVDASRLNPNTIMPPYYRTEELTNVAPAYAGKPILSAEQIEDVVAFLGTLRD